MGKNPSLPDIPPPLSRAAIPHVASPSLNPWEYAASLFEPPPPYDSDIKLWAKDRLDEFLWSKQEEICNSVVSERYTAVQSCHNAGKSFIASRIAAWWIDIHEPGEAFVVSTAPTSAQVSAILWREIGKAHRKGSLPGSIVTAGYPQWKIANGELVGYGRKPADYSEAAFQGIHALYVLIIIDEACGVDKSLYDAVDSLATNLNARVLAIGNPDDPTSHFASVCKPDSGWNVLRIDGLRTPNFTRQDVEWLDCPQCRKAGEDTPLLARLYAEEHIPYSDEQIPESLRPMLLSPLWVEERLHRWVGRVRPDQSISVAASASPLFTSKVRGLFPDSASDGVIPLGWVERAMARGRDLADSGFVPTGRKVLGVDVADEGADETAIAIRKGNRIVEIRRHPNSDTMQTVALIEAALNEPEAFPVVDVIGVGAGVVSRLRELRRPVMPFNAAKSAGDRRDKSGEFRFSNMRAWAWWHLRELLDPANGHNLALPDDEMLKADLTAPQWQLLQGGKIQIEAKKDIRKRLGRSTDLGDAVLMAFVVDSWDPDSDAATPHALSWWGTPATQDSLAPLRGADNVLNFDGRTAIEEWLADVDNFRDVGTW